MRWLVVVRREEPGLYVSLRRRFEGILWVEVIVDRRMGERRGRSAAVSTDRRRADRRWPLVPQERDRWQSFGYRLVRTGQPPA